MNNRRPPRPNHYPSARGDGSAVAEEDSRFIDEDLGYDRRYTTKESWERSGRDRLPRDHEITDPQIMVLDNGTIEGPLATRYVLTKIAPEESLRMFQPYKPAKDGSPAEYAICKIVDKKAEHEKIKESQERKKENGGGGKSKTKEMELSWGIGDHDLMTKLRHLAAFVEKGMKVDIVLGKKRKGKKVSEEEARAVVGKVREEIERCGGKEGKKATGEIGATYRLHVEKN
jgi:translation initiation factor IF-3